MTQRKRSPWIWVSLGCIGLMAIVFILGLTCWNRFRGTEEGQAFLSGMEMIEKLSVSLPTVATAMQQHLTEHGDYPETLDDLKGNLDATVLDEIKAQMTYTKPAEDAPADTTIMTTGWKYFMKGSSVEIRMQKDFEMFHLSKQALEDR